MRFQITEYKEIKAAIESSPLDYGDFSFVKKRGWVNIHYREEALFRFHRKRITELDESLQWKFTDEYTIEIDKRKVQESSRQEMMSHFNTWIMSIVDFEA